MKEYKNSEIVDAIVIGTGAGGAPILARLAAAGLSVVGLEAGKKYNPDEDFATDERAQHFLYWNHERLSAGSDPLPFGKNNSGIGFGGSTLHFTGYTPRPQPDDFTIKSDFGKGLDWPFGYFELEDYYDEVEYFIGVSGPKDYPWGPKRKTSYPMPPLPFNGAAELMERACAKLGIKTSSAANAILSQPYSQPNIPTRNACTNRGFCEAGCSTGAKASTDMTYLPLAVHHGAEIRTECFVTELHTAGDGKMDYVVYVQNGIQKKQFCKHVFLCAGAVETPRLLLLNNLANRSGQVGKNFMANVGSQLWGEFPDMIQPFKGVPATLISEDTHRPADADFAGGYLLQSIGVMPLSYATQVTRATGVWGSELRERMNRYNFVAGINMHGDCLPYESNFLELSDELDELGLPKPRIYFTAGENERKMAVHGEKQMQEIWDAAGAKNSFVIQRYAHTIGTCRMGTHAEDSVVNSFGKSHDINNLYISDNSIFPTSLSVNPALSIMAISLRIADNFIQNLNT